MKKTLSMLLALCMVVALVAMPVAAEATQTAKVATMFNIDAFETGTVLTSELLADNNILKYAGVGANADVTYTKADGSTGALLNYNPLNFDASVPSLDNGGSQVEVVELDGEKVLAIKSKSTAPAAIAFAPLAAGALADGKTAKVSFEFNQPATDFTGRVNIGLGLDNGEGIDFLEANKPTDTSTDYVASGVASRYVNNAEYGYLSLTFRQFSVASPALFFSRTNSAGQYTGGGAWSNGRANNANNTTYADTEAARKEAMGKWYKVSYEMTLKDNGIWVRVYSNDVDATALQYTEYLYPMTEAELAGFDGNLSVILSAQDPYSEITGGQVYVRNICQYGDVEVPANTYSNVAISENSFENFALGTRPQTAAIYAGAGAGVGHTCISPYADSRLTDEKNTVVALNPATDKGNESGKVLKVFNKVTGSNDNVWLGFHTNAFTVANLQSENGVTIQYDYYKTGNFNNGRFVLTGANADGSETVIIAQDTPTNYRLVSHVIGAELAPQTSAGVQRYTSFDSTKAWVRVYANYKMDADGYVTMTEWQENLATGEVKAAKSWEYGVKMDMGKRYTFSCGFNYPNSADADGNAAYYFDNIKVTVDVMDNGDYKVYCAEDANSVYATAEEFYAELPFAAVNTGALLKGIKVTDSSDVEVPVNVSTELVDGTQVVTFALLDTLVEEEVYTISMGDARDINGNAYDDIKFVAVPDWNPYDPENPAEITVDFGTDDLTNVPYGAEGTIAMADGVYGDYPTNYYSVTSSDENVIEISDLDGAVYTATVKGSGTAYITVKNLVAPAEAEVVYEVTSLGISTTYDVTFIDGENETVVSVGEGWAANAPEPAGQDGRIFAAWAYDQDGAEIADLSSVTSDATVYAVYRDVYEVSFKSNDPELGTVAVESVKVAAGFGIEEIPSVIPSSVAKFVAWEDGDGNRYTNEELAALTFDSDAGFYAIFAKAVIDIDKVYDFTTMTMDELNELQYAFPSINGSNATLDNEKGLYYDSSNETEFIINVDDINSGIYVLEVDYYLNAGSGGANIEMKTSESKDLQGMYVVGYVHTRKSIDNFGPVIISNLPNTAEEFHNAKFYMDFDNGVYYVVLDGVAGVTSSDPLLLNQQDLSYIRVHNFTGMNYQKISLKKLDSLAVNTITVEQPEFGTAVVGTGNVTTYTIPADAKTHIYCAPVEGVAFEGWTTTGGTIEDASANKTFIIPGGEDVTVTAATSEIYVDFTFEETDYVTFTEETAALAQQNFKFGEKPAGAPEVVVKDGYTLAGWVEKYSDGSFSGTILSTDTIVGNRASHTAVWVPIVNKAINYFVGYVPVEAQLGETFEVSADYIIGADVTEGYVTITYDPAVVEYVGGTVAEALETEVYFKKVADGEIRAIINTDDSVTLNGALGTLKFKAIATGTTELAISAQVELVQEDKTVKYVIEKESDYGTITIGALRGDVNFDGKINLYDAIAVLKHVSDIATLDDAALAVADVDATEGVSVSDATHILKYIARIIDVL